MSRDRNALSVLKRPGVSRTQVSSIHIEFEMVCWAVQICIRELDVSF